MNLQSYLHEYDVRRQHSRVGIASMHAHIVLLRRMRSSSRLSLLNARQPHHYHSITPITSTYNRNIESHHLMVNQTRRELLLPTLLLVTPLRHITYREASPSLLNRASTDRFDTTVASHIAPTTTTTYSSAAAEPLCRSSFNSYLHLRSYSLSIRHRPSIHRLYSTAALDW